MFRSNLFQSPEHVRERVRKRRAEAQQAAEDAEAAAHDHATDDDEGEDDEHMDESSHQSDIIESVSRPYRTHSRVCMVFLTTCCALCVWCSRVL